MSGPVIRLLRGALVALLLVSVVAQVLLPLFASQQEATVPELAPVVVPYAVVGILVIACAQLALLAIWRLLSFVERRVIFSRRALRWVDLITGCGAVATVLSAGVLLHLILGVGVSHGVVTLGLVATLACGLAFVLLMVVMRGLLGWAIADRAELDEVI